MADRTKIQTSGTLPANCSVGDLYVKTGSSAGLYVCLASNTWTGPLSTGSGTVTNAAALTANALMVGAGSNAAAVLASLGTTTTLLHGNAAGAPTFGAVSLTADVTGNLPVGNLGSGTAASGGTFWRGDGTWAAVTPGSGGGNTINSTAVGSEPGSPSAGDVDLYSNGVYVARYSGSAWVPWGPMFPFVKPVDADFAWVNQGSATVDATNGGIFLRGVASSGANLRIRKKTAPATPYVITAAFQWFHVPNTNNAQECGLLFRESGTGKVLTYGMTQSSGTNYFVSQYWTDATTYSSGNYLVSGSNVTSGLIWFRIADNGVNRIFSFSFDGQHFITYDTTGRTVNLTPDEVGFYVQETSNVTDTGMLLYSWQQS